MDLVPAFRMQARACADLGSPMYADLLGAAAEDLARGGVTREVLAGHELDPGPSALALRLAGSVHRLVLSGRAPGLAGFYPSAGGTWDPAPGWEAFARLLRDRPRDVRAWLDIAPQTNEVGRSAALMGALLRVGERFRHPVRLFEIGASGGLNLRADRFCYVSESGARFGPAESPVRLDPAWRTLAGELAAWPDLDVVERLGCDVAPVDVATEEGRLTLRSYVWPDQEARLRRLESAFVVAGEVHAAVRAQSAAAFVQGLQLADGATTVLWHSVMWQYLSRDEQRAVTARIEGLGEEATESAPFAHAFLEPLRRAPDSDHEFLVVLQLWPAGERRILGASAGHGVPTVWE